MNAASEDETRDPRGHRREELARRLDVELDEILGPPVADSGYRDAITEVAMVILADLLEHPEHRALPGGKDDTGSQTLYRILMADPPHTFDSHVTSLMWDTSVRAADAVLAHLAAGD